MSGKLFFFYKSNAHRLLNPVLTRTESGTLNQESWNVRPQKSEHLYPDFFDVDHSKPSSPLNLRGSCNFEFSNSCSSLYRTLSLDWIPWQLKADMVACRSWSRKAGKLSRQAESCFGNRGDWKGWRNSLLYCTFFWFWGRVSWKAPQAHAHGIWASHLGIWRWINSSCFWNTDWKSWCCHLLGKSDASSSNCNVC